MRKIGILLPSLELANGICKVPATHSKMFAEAGYDVDIITEFGDGKPIHSYNGRVINLSIKKRTGVFKILSLIELVTKLRKIKIKNKYDYFISHTPHCDIANIITKRNEKVITTIHTNITEYYSKSVKKIFPLIIKYSDSIVAVSSEIEKFIKNKYQNDQKICSIYNPVDINSILQLSKEELPEHLKNKSYILNVGRLNRSKGQWHLLKAFSLLTEENPDLYLVIVGGGELKNELTTLARNLNIQDKVYFEGVQSNPYKYMKNSKAFVLPSLFEGLPLVLIEAMVCKTPIISSDCISGPKELLSYKGDKAGILVPDLGDFNELSTSKISDFDRIIAEQISFILKDKVAANKMTQKAYERAHDFSLEKILISWENLFNQLNKDVR